MRLCASCKSDERARPCSVTSDETGQFEIANVPFNNYQVRVAAPGFASFSQSLSVRSSVASNVKVVLQIAAAASTGDRRKPRGTLVETDPTFHTDVDRDMFIKVPMESQSSSLSSLVTATTPGVSADSNGLFHGSGDTMPPIRFLSTGRRSPISKAKCSRTRFLPIPFNRSR